MVMTIGDDDIAVSHDNEDGNDYDDKRCSTIPIVQFFFNIVQKRGGGQRLHSWYRAASLMISSSSRKLRTCSAYYHS